MIIIREILGALLFMSAMLVTVYLCTNQFSWTYLAIAIGCYLASYWIWPSKREGQREESYLWLDILEMFIEIPFRIFGWLFRLMKNSDAPDIDL